MSQPMSNFLAQVPAAFKWPVTFCLISTATTYIASIVTGNVSQVDRVWTFLPTIYTAYFALLPIWPNEARIPILPYTPKEIGSLVTRDFSPRATLMLVLVVSGPFVYKRVFSHLV
jgi:hypothetical protein